MPEVLTNPALQLALASVFAAAGVYLLLPKPRRRSLALGWFLVVASVAVLAAFVVLRFGRPSVDLVGTVLFWLFAAGAVGFAVLMVSQRNPARGAIAFAFVILSVCGLFLLLAAPFLMAATVIIYAGAIIVTFLFVLMLSHASGPSDENDRTREPLLGSLAGFAFVGLVLFTLHQSAPAAEPVAKEADPPPGLLAPPLSAAERDTLTGAYARLDEALADGATDEQRFDAAHDAQAAVEKMLAPDGFDRDRRRFPTRKHVQFEASRADPRIEAFLKRTEELKKANDALGENPGDAAAARRLRDELRLYSGNGLLPARNVATLGMALYSEHLLAVEMAGALLLVATVGAVAIAHRRKDGAA